MLEAPPAAETPAVVLLIVDDDPEHREMLCNMLAEAGYGAEAASNGRAALERLHEGWKPGLILLDLMMPVMDGWRFMAELKNDPALASIPVIVTTGGGDRVLSTAPVAAGYLNKPITRNQLLELIALCLFRTRGRH